MMIDDKGAEVLLMMIGDKGAEILLMMAYCDKGAAARITGSRFSWSAAHFGSGCR